MSSDDWPQVDPNNVSLPAIVSSTDLFDGELFGDELIDIYNSTVGEHGEVVDHGKFFVMKIYLVWKSERHLCSHIGNPSLTWTRRHE
jgi:hypothetical protein